MLFSQVVYLPPDAVPPPGYGAGEELQAPAVGHHAPQQPTGEAAVQQSWAIERTLSLCDNAKAVACVKLILLLAI